MIIQKDGRKCTCGKNGCFETYASMKVFKTEIRKRFNNEKLSGKEILELLQDKSNLEKVEDIIQEYIGYVAIGVSNFARICSADTVVVGGSFVYFKDILFDRLLKELDRIMIPMEKENTKIKIAKLENDAGIIGATKITY
jgi:predicted NBD/HSP70 family sugar kinase